MSVQSYSNRYITNFNSNINSIITNALLFTEARENLNNNDWKEFYKKTKLTYRIIQVLTKIGKNKVLTNKKYIDKLPSSVFSLYELLKIKDERLIKLIDDNKINSNTTRFEIQKLNGLEIDSILKREGTNRFINIRLNKKSFQLKHLKDFSNDLKNLVKKYQDKVLLDVEDFKVEERLEKEKTKLIRRLRHELDMEKQNSEKKDYRKIYNRFKERLENLGKDSLEESKKILDNY
jgi:hypothetical protein